jgi:hypothetical protein
MLLFIKNTSIFPCRSGYENSRQKATNIVHLVQKVACERTNDESQVSRLAIVPMRYFEIHPIESILVIGFRCFKLKTQHRLILYKYLTPVYD